MICLNKVKPETLIDVSLPLKLHEMTAVHIYNN